MRRSRALAPAAQSVAGALFLGLIAVLLPVLVSCSGGEEPPDPRVLVLGADTIVLPDSIGLVVFEVGRRQDGATRFEPEAAQASPGDVVRFASLDNGAHAIAFDAVSLAPDARAYLEQSGQLRSPPLLARDAAWVVNLEGAPPGRYPFTCATHGERGTLTVTARR